MKKNYMTPSVVMVKLAESTIMAGSDLFTPLNTTDTPFVEEENVGAKRGASIFDDEE